MPGDDLRKIQKAITLDVDCICMDMEDGVALNRKAEARQTILTALNSLDFGRSERLARINRVGSGLESEDLEAVLPARPAGIVVPKVETTDEVRWVDGQLSSAESRFGWPDGSLALIIQAETARGVINLAQVCTASSRLQAVIFGAEDLAGDMGAIRTRAGWEVFYARGAVVTHAAAFGLQAIDMVYVDFHDPEGLRREALEGARMGYAGKQIIHPNQVEIVQDVFTPGPEEIDRASRLMEAYREHQAAGRGAFAWEGKMVDAPVVKAAERVLDRARAAGKVTG
jgi:citrate lyase beta subunit